MKQVLKKSRIEYLVNNRNGYLILASGSIILNIILAAMIYLMLGYEKIVLVPPEMDREFWISSNKASAEYLSAMSIFLSEIRLNITPSNAAIQRNLFLRYVDSKNYEILKSTLIDEEKQLKKENVTLTFFMTSSPLIDAEHMVAIMYGDLQYMVGDVLQPIRHVTYQISYRLNAGRLMVKSFEEIKNHG